MPFAEDLDPYFADFGIIATVGGVACTAIFDNAYAQSLGFTAGTAPVLLVAASAVPTVAPGDAVEVPAGRYTVAGIEPDGTGITLLRLEAA